MSRPQDSSDDDEYKSSIKDMAKRPQETIGLMLRGHHEITTSKLVNTVE